MAYLRALQSDVDNVFQLQRYGIVMPARVTRAQPVRRDLAAAVFCTPRQLARSALQSLRCAVEARRGRQQLMQLDDRLLRDIGLTRAEVCFGDLETLSRNRREGGI